MNTKIHLNLVSVLLISACGAQQLETVNLQDLSLPDARPIGLGSAKTNLKLQDSSSNDCDRFSELGVFGIPLGLACHTGPLVGNMLYGSQADLDGDGELTCADYEGVSEKGILAGLLCNEDIASFSQIESMRFKGETTGEIAVDFSDYDSSDEFEAVGSWTGTGDASGRFPGNMRIWGSPDQSDIDGVFAAALESGTKGKVYFDLNPYGATLSGDISFVHQEDASLCESNPSMETCHYQEIRLKGVETGGENSPPPGLHLRIFANAKQDPSFFMIEGSIRINAEYAQSLWADDQVAESIPELLDVREIYFRTVRANDELWGSFDFKGENNESLDLAVSPINGVTVNFGAILRDSTKGVEYAGICQNFGSDEQVNCEGIDYSRYESIWTGDDEINGLEADYEMAVDMRTPPAEQGIILK